MNKSYRFNNFIYNVNNNIITETDILLAINKFTNHLASLAEKDKFAILFKIRNSEGKWRNISSLQILDKTELNDLHEILNIFWSYKSDFYHGMLVDKIVFRYRFIESNIPSLKSRFNYPTSLVKSNALLPEGYKNLPSNRLFHSWGDTVNILDSNTFTVSNGLHSFFIKKLDNEFFIKLLYKNKELLSFKDKYSNNEDNKDTFIRYIGNSELHYDKGKCVFVNQGMPIKYIQRKLQDITIKDNFITMDLETRDIGNEKQVMSASIFDGIIVKSFYVKDFINGEELLKESIIYLFQRKYNGFRVYLHNFSNFDGIFMIRVLAKMDNCLIDKPLIRDGKLINVKVNYNLHGKRKYTIFFRDSLLILPASLRKLGQSFNVEIKKSIYPYAFVNNSKVELDYIGEVPDFKFFNTIDIQEVDKKFNGDIEKYDIYKINKNLIDIVDYKEYCNNYENHSWSLRGETVKYCENDVKSLHLIIKQFQKRIWKLFSLDINKYPTLSSIAFAIYRIKYLKDFKIPIISGEIYRDLKNSYTGGSVDVYKPIGFNINRYDVNSLYPSVMADFPCPVGKITKFKGNIDKYDSGAFGFFFTKVKTPDNLHIPILQTRVKTDKGGIRTVSPLGEWTGWYFSEEINNAKKYGYQFEIEWGYTFEKEFIFKEYVDDLYRLKKESNRKSADFIIAKLLLNGLYGRFGMSPDKEIHQIVKGNEEIGKFIINENINILDLIELDDDIELISYTNNKEYEEDLSFNNISVPVASAITAYARIKMSEIKTLYSDNIYYSDTDSIDLDIKLSEKYISNNLGDLKLECNFKEVIYIAPKVYAAITSNLEEYVVVKGYKDEDIKYNQIKTLINKNASLILNQEKWYKDISQGKILTKNERYTLMATENKRKLIYQNNKLIASTPYALINGKLI